MTHGVVSVALKSAAVPGSRPGSVGVSRISRARRSANGLAASTS